MMQPDPQVVVHPDQDRVEEALRQMVRPAGSLQRVWQRIEAGQRVPLQAHPSARPKPLAAGGVGRAWRWLAPSAAAAVLVLALILWRTEWLRDRLHPQGAHLPVPTSPESSMAARGGTQRGADLVSGDQATALTLGNYCHIELAPQTRLRIESQDRAEAVYLYQGQITCDVDHGVGGFEVRSEIGTVRVQGTKFRTTLEDQIDPSNSIQGDGPVFTRRLVVSVFSGIVLVNGIWGDVALAAGQNKAFTKDAIVSDAPPQTGAGAVKIGAAAQGGGAPVIINGGWGGYVAPLPIVSMVTELNMTPDFTLDKDQKTRIQDIRDEWKKANDQFLAENADKLTELNNATTEALKARDMEMVTALSKERQALMAQGPKMDDFSAKIKDSLTADQRKVVEEKELVQKAQMQQRRNPGSEIR
jgi:hypothetical protein